MSGSPSRAVAHDVAPKAGQRAAGWLLIVVSPVPFGVAVVALFQSWDRLGQLNSPLWVLPAAMLCYGAFTAALLCAGIGLVSCRATLVRNGGWLFLGSLLTMLTLFSIFD